MTIRSAKLFWLLCCTVAVLFTSLAGAHASTCLPSAAAVKSAYPSARPHWTFRAHNRDGARCWHPGTQAAAHGQESGIHQASILPDRDPIVSPKPVVVSVDRLSDWGLSTTVGETSGTGWSLQVPAAPASGQSSFAERFAAVFEVIIFESPSLMRRMESLLSNTP